MITVIADWNSDNPQLTWSGIPYGIANALKNYTKIDTKSVTLPKYQWVLGRSLNKIFWHTSANPNPLERYFINQLLKSRLDSNANNLYMSVSPSTLFNNPNGWIFCDLTVGFLLYCRIHDMESFSKSGFDIPLIELKRWHNYQENSFQNIKGVFTMSKWLRDYLINVEGKSPENVIYGGAGINLKPEWVDTFVSSETRKSRNRILFVGRDFARKGGPEVLEAFHILRKKRPDLELYIAGGYQGISEKGIFYLGNIAPEKLYTYYNKCDIFCMPSHFEAYGIVFAEALTFGLPCIGRNKFGMPEIIEDGITGRLLNTRSIKELCECIEELLENENYYQNVREKRDFYISEYSWDTVAKRIWHIMEEKN